MCKLFWSVNCAVRPSRVHWAGDNQTGQLLLDSQIRDTVRPPSIRDTALSQESTHSVYSSTPVGAECWRRNGAVPVCCSPQRQGAQRALYSCRWNLDSTIALLTSTLWQRLGAPKKAVMYSYRCNRHDRTCPVPSCQSEPASELRLGSQRQLLCGSGTPLPPQGFHGNPELQVSDGSLSRSVLPIVQHQGGHE